MRLWRGWKRGGGGWLTTTIWVSVSLMTVMWWWCWCDEKGNYKLDKKGGKLEMWVEYIHFIWDHSWRLRSGFLCRSLPWFGLSLTHSTMASNPQQFYLTKLLSPEVVDDLDMYGSYLYIPKYDCMFLLRSCCSIGIDFQGKNAMKGKTQGKKAMKVGQEEQQTRWG